MDCHREGQLPFILTPIALTRSRDSDDGHDKFGETDDLKSAVTEKVKLWTWKVTFAPDPKVRKSPSWPRSWANFSLL